MAWRRTVGSSSVERYVAVLTAGGALLVVGLWVTAFAAPWSFPWVAGATAAGLGAAGVAAGITAGVDVGPL